MGSFRSVGFRGRRAIGGVSLALLGGVVVACGSGAEPKVTSESHAAITSASSISHTSCQALDVATFFTDPTNQGSTTFAIDKSGNLQGWGYNDTPWPLGFDNRIAKVPSPTKLGVSGATAVAAHQQGACAIVAGGAVSCVGQALGSGSVVDPGAVPGSSVTPVVQSTDGGYTQVALTGAVGIAAGLAHACVWKADGSAWCWGSDQSGQFGDGANPNGGVLTSVPPVATYAVPMLDTSGNALADVAAIAAAENTTCVLHKSGLVECVGANAAGELGQGGGATNTQPTGLLAPIQVATGTVFSAVFGGGGGTQGATAGGTFCASTAVPTGGTAQTTYCWGYNANAQADIVDTKSVTAPYPVSTHLGSSWGQGALDACEVTASGAVSCWGNNNYAQLPGVAASNLVFEENAIPGVSTAYKVAIGHGHICALANNGLWCWGDNTDGEIGNGAMGGTSAPYDLRLSTPPPSCGQGQCGTVTNSCGESINCGGCSDPTLTCVNNACTCVPMTASDACYNSCGGWVPNGCGGQVRCPTLGKLACCEQQGGNWDPRPYPGHCVYW